MKYKFIDKFNQSAVNEEEVRQTLFEFALDCMKEFYPEYRSKEFGWNLQFNDIEIALKGTIEEVLKCLKLYYGCLIEVVNEEDK